MEISRYLCKLHNFFPRIRFERRGQKEIVCRRTSLWPEYEEEKAQYAGALIYLGRLSGVLRSAVRPSLTADL